MQKMRRAIFISYDRRFPGGNGRATGNTPAHAGSRYLRGNRAVRWLLLFAMLCTCSVAAQQPGQDDLSGQSMEELVKMKVDSVYGAAKFLQKAEDAATSITVVTAEEIQKHGYRTLADVLQQRPRLLRDQRPQLQLCRCPRIVTAGGLQRAHSLPAGWPSSQRQHFRRSLCRHGIPGRYRSDRAH